MWNMYTSSYLLSLCIGVSLAVISILDVWLLFLTSLKLSSLPTADTSLCFYVISPVCQSFSINGIIVCYNNLITGVLLLWNCFELLRRDALNVGERQYP